MCASGRNPTVLPGGIGMAFGHSEYNYRMHEIFAFAEQSSLVREAEQALDQEYYHSAITRLMQPFWNTGMQSMLSITLRRVPVVSSFDPTTY